MAKKNNHNITDEIAETMREVFETAEQNMITKKNQFLMNKGKNQAAFKKTLVRDGESIVNYLKKIAERAGKLGDFNPDKIIRQAEKGTKLLVDSAVKGGVQELKQLNRLERIMPLKEAIFKQTQIGINKGMPITYKNGSKIGYKEYMEMNVRTTIQHEIGEQQLKFGKDANVVFYICNSYADCADDHKDFQGKIYYDERWASYNLQNEIKDKIGDYIKSNRLMSVQRVRDGSPYLTTRPNCRHTFTPISIDQALGMSTKKLLNDLKLERGTYKSKNYEQLKQQRYNERQIRFYKARAKMNEELLGMDKGNELLQQQIRKDNFLTRKWQKKQRELVSSNPLLERDYRRETKDILLKDLGAKYNTPIPEENEIDVFDDKYRPKSVKGNLYLTDAQLRKRYNTNILEEDYESSEWFNEKYKGASDFALKNIKYSYYSSLEAKKHEEILEEAIYSHVNRPLLFKNKQEIKKWGEDKGIFFKEGQDNENDAPMMVYNDIIPAIIRAREEIPEFKGLKFKFDNEKGYKSNHAMSTRLDSDNTMVFSTAGYFDEDYEKSVRSILNAQSTGGNINGDGTVATVAYHELGHILSSKLQASKDFYSYGNGAEYTEFFKGKGKKIKSLSKYSKQDDEEAFAEAFSQYMTQPESKEAKDFGKFLDTLRNKPDRKK